MAGTGAKKVVISCTGDKSIKSMVFKRQGTSRKIFWLAQFLNFEC